MVEKGLRSAVTARNLLLINLVFLIIREFTLEQGPLSAVNVGNLLIAAQVSLVIRELTLEKGPDECS